MVVRLDGKAADPVFCYAVTAMQKPKYMTPGSRSAIEGSGTTNSFPTPKMGAGELTPPGLVSYPAGAANVSYQNGATTPAKAASTIQVGITPLTYKKD